MKVTTQLWPRPQRPHLRNGHRELYLPLRSIECNWDFNIGAPGTLKASMWVTIQTLGRSLNASVPQSTHLYSGAQYCTGLLPGLEA